MGTFGWVVGKWLGSVAVVPSLFEFEFFLAFRAKRERDFDVSF